MQVAIFGPSTATIPLGHGAGQWRFSRCLTQVMCCSRAASGGPAAPPLDAWGAMRRRTITIAAPQHRHRSLRRSLNGAGVEGCMPGVHGAIALGLSPIRNSVSRCRCLQLG